MLKVERHSKILGYLEAKGFATSRDIAQKFDVSQITVRRDLKELSKQNLIRLEHGGASDINYLLNGRVLQYNVRSFINIERKRAIGKKAAELIEDGESIILDTGTTTIEIAKNIRKLKFNNLTVATNDLIIALELCRDEHVKVIFLGGELRPLFYSSYSYYTEEILENLKVNKCFMGADSIDEHRGVFNFYISEVPVKQKMISISDQVILVSDSTKVGASSLHKVCDFKEIDKFITDSEIKGSFIEFLESIGVSVLIV